MPRTIARNTVLDLPDALEPLVDYYRAIAGEHPDWDEYRAAMAKQGKALLRITPTRWDRSRRAASRPGSWISRYPR